MINKTNILVVLFLPISLFSQIGGTSAFSFINVEASPRIEAMGGVVLAIYDHDLLLAQTTPSLLNKKMHNALVFSFVDYFADIHSFAFAFAREINHIGSLSIGIKSINYGDFLLNDASGNNYGVFFAQEQVMTLGIGKSLNERFSIGANINLFNSQLESYTSFLVAANISTTYHHIKKKFTSTFLIKNIGRQLYAYANRKENVPFEIQFAIGKELSHLPFTYQISYTNLNQFDIKSPYKQTTQTNFDTGELEIKEETIAKTFLRHLVVGGELNPFRRGLFLRGGFNFQRRFDMSLSSYPAMTGFSWGIGFKVLKFRIDYSRASYHLSAHPNNFSIATNLSTFGL